MCCKNRGPRCSTCHKPAPYHRCRCPAKYASKPTIDSQHDGLPSYAAAVSPQSLTSNPLPISTQARCGGRGYGGCGSRRRQFRGPIHLLINLIVRKVQEKQKRERQAAFLSGERENEVQEDGVIEAVDEKPMGNGEVEGEKKDEDVKFVAMSVRSLSM